MWKDLDLRACSKEGVERTDDQITHMILFWDFAYEIPYLLILVFF